MAWLVRRAEEGRAKIRGGEFFARMRAARSLQDLDHYLAQLQEFSPMFISALCARAADPDPAFADAWRRHAMEEADHPEQYQRWRSARGLVSRERPTRETLELAALCMWSATREDGPTQAIRLCLVAEGVALDTFTATLATFAEIGVDPGPGRFWPTHRNVDGDHMLLGLELVPVADESTPCGRAYAEALDHTLDMFGRMLASW